MLTLRTTAFVENDEGFGVTQAFDVDKVLNDAYLLRFSNSLRMSEETDGVRWRVRPALYQAIDYRRAMRYEAFVRGETDGTEPDLYGVGVTHRRSAWRDWLFFEIGVELFWADGPLPADRCSACVGAAIGVEILFGEAYDRLLRRDARKLPAEAPSRRGSMSCARALTIILAASIDSRPQPCNPLPRFDRLAESAYSPSGARANGRA